MYLIESILEYNTLNQQSSVKITKEKKEEYEKLFSDLIVELEKAIMYDIDTFTGQKGYDCGCALLKAQKGEYSIDQFRKECKLCPQALGHWMEFCTKDCINCSKENNGIIMMQYINITFPKQKEFEIALSSLTYAIRLLWNDHYSKLFVNGLQQSYFVGKGELSLDQFRSHNELCKEKCCHWESCCTSLGCESIIQAR